MALVFHDGTALAIGDAFAITQNGSVTLRLTPQQVIAHQQDVDIAWYIYPAAVIEMPDPSTNLFGNVTLRLTPSATITLGQNPNAPITHNGDITLRLTPAAGFSQGEPQEPPIDQDGGVTLRLTPAAVQGAGTVWVPRIVVTTTWTER